MNGGARRAPARLAWAALLLGAVAVAVGVDLPSLTAEVASALRGAGGASRLGFLVVSTVGTVVFLPATVTTLVAGFAWGPVEGTLLVWPSATAGAVGAFLLARTVLRATVERRFAADPRFQAVEAAIRREGFQLVFWLRLSPLFPFNVLNYVLGVTSVGLVDYTLGTAVGALPGTVLYVWMGSTASDVAAVMRGGVAAGDPGRAVWWLGALASVAVSVKLGRIANKALDAELLPPAPPDAPAPSDLPAADPPP